MIRGLTDVEPIAPKPLAALATILGRPNWVKKFRAELHRLRFPDVEGLGKGHIPIVLARAENQAQPRIAAFGN